ncbi:hypothetical protein SAMN02745753_04075 [Marinomonas polaris DSM 16579]|jgi:hypothetical protein|uniref:Uncharacterized protein n=1 Tax=Marinomonas polaris DSM 16579 TaxID=1122206 RepID=A0A1M5KIE9_9GAMM|nr:hypothetical protein [Marinomonas polaris]SHG52616.1 hypothetical protein SAMN02745753_04075 [Marinomonas polaris DSM 16579]
MQEYDYYTIDEIFKALESNTDAVLTRATAISKSFINKYGLAIEAEDVFHEAVVRILDDTRHVPKNVPLSYSIGQMIKSICHGMLELNKEKIFNQSESIDGYDDAIAAPTTDEDSDSDPEWDILMSIFDKDDDAIAFLAATKNGLNKSAIVSSIFGGDEKAYDTTRRRIVRNGKKYLKEAG